MEQVDKNSNRAKPYHKHIKTIIQCISNFCFVEPETLKMVAIQSESYLPLYNCCLLFTRFVLTLTIPRTYKHLPDLKQTTYFKENGDISKVALI